MNRATGQGGDAGASLTSGAASKGQLACALVLASLVPLLVAGYGVYGMSLAGMSAGLGWLLIAAAAVSSAAGAAILWSRPAGAEPPPLPAPAPETAPPNAPPVASTEPESEAEHAQGELDTMMDSFSRVLVTIEQQAAEINQYAVRLDNAYKEIETSSAKLKEFSFKDEVTGLYNRRFFSIRLEEEVSRYRRFNHPASVVLIDLDGFKAVNDELGHAAGDETLRGVADILLKHSRGINVICRYGGDEFAILLVETAKAGAWLYADRIRYVLPTHHFSHGRLVTASFGIAALPEDVAPSPDELIRAADEALYAAKRAGKNRVSVHGDAVPARPTPDRPST